MSATELKFDNMEYNTTLAKDFLDQHSKFVGFNCENHKTVTNKIGKEICLGKRKKENFEFNLEEEKVTKKKLYKLSQLMERNIELFCQLEYLIRGKQPDELKAFDLKLIVQNLLFCSSEKYQYPNDGRPDTVSMKNNSPLVTLTMFARSIINADSRMNIISETESAIICWLFVDLCRQAGFGDQICLIFEEHDVVSDRIECHFGIDVKAAQGSCIVVVTGKADIDSAVDTLVDAPHRSPWGVRRVLVQENALERFRTALRGKARVCPGEVTPALSQRSTSAVAICDMTFLVEYAGEDSEEGIIVEAYRTVKELISLLSKQRPYLLSVWCDSTSESNEIAHNVDANVVWVNTYGVFDGPPQACETILRTAPLVVHITVSDDFKRARSAWEKFSIFERAARLRDSLHAHKIDTHDSFYYASKNFTCARMEKAAGTLFLSESLYTRYAASHLLTYMVKGGSIAFSSEIMGDKDVSGLYETLKNCGAPVEEIDSPEGGDLTAYMSLDYTQKVIWTSYGTTFAN
ncbi:uncharacterized protein LOC121736827 [Aricia agestis]|uniref:uncharacterized protein LOC121736827 n=1 Tax=Aricia agestis TaxID=91739 RepID=UPI001C20AA19|nr:uncharacterized protein LOC121736827 [Aricia agestis]XP_041984182.1 uncharacterized protein LOC121736827 [Aricia agestis]